MLNTYNSSSQTAVVNQVLVYDTDAYNQGTAISHVPGSGVITLNSPGVYQVSFNGVATATADTTGDASEISVQLYNNSVAVSNAIGSDSIQTTADIANVGFSVLVEGPVHCACPCPCSSKTVSLTVQNTGVEAEYSLANLIVIKVR